jgi:sugar phosphate isomerase/epimerase
MNISVSRRNFFGSAAALLAVPPAAPAAGKDAGVKLGVCSYSFTNKMKLPEAIQAVKTLGLHAINIKPEFHLPYASTAAEIAAARKMLDDAGLQLVGTGTTYLTKMDEAEIRQRFEFNKALASPLIVIGPTAETMPVIEKYVKQYDIKVAIHNHGPSDKNFPTPESALKVIQKMDPRVGVCMDIGHTIRAGVDPVAAAKDAGPRLLDMHFKDVRKEANGNWTAVDVGEGDIAIAALLRQLEKMRYAGHCNLEHEVRGDDRLPGMQKSFAYMRGVLAGLA